MTTVLKKALLASLLLLACLLSLIACIVAYAFWVNEPEQPRAFARLDEQAAMLVGEVAQAKALDFNMEAHPFMASQGNNGMHADSYNSDVHAKGPLGNNPQINTRRGSMLYGGQCATLTFDSEGHLLMLCAGFSGFRIHLLEARTLRLLAEYKLPIRPSMYDALFYLDFSYIMEDSSGAYFYLDAQDRVVMAASDQSIRRIAHKQDAKGQWAFYTENQWDLSQHVPHDCTHSGNIRPTGECDPITAVLPDFQGLLWWVTRQGRLGTLNPDTGVVKGIQLSGEEIQNGFAVASDGIYIVSDHALYQFSANEVGEPIIGWQQVYDRGSHRKVGTINQGSGTSPTLIGDDYITITDNADGRIRLNVYHRQTDFKGERLLCSIPLFDEGHSVTDNSVIAINRSIIIENNAGYRSVFSQKDWSKAGGGISRIDIREDNSGCDRVWHSNEKSPSVVPKLAYQTGLAYFYTFELREDGDSDWYLTALDFETGETRFRIRTGQGTQFNNNWSPIALAPDGTAYIGTFGGVIAIWDGS